MRIWRKRDKKKDKKLDIKADSYAFESNVHFPTDLSLAWDAARKCIEYATKAERKFTDIKGWRKHSEWKSKIKNQKRILERVIYRGKGKKKEAQIIKGATKYIAFLQLLSNKIEKLILNHNDINGGDIKIRYFYRMLQIHTNLIDRRLLKNEKISSKDKVYSIFQPYTEWLSKGKVGKKLNWV